MHLSNLFQSLFISSWPSSLRSCPAVQKGTLVSVGNRKKEKKKTKKKQSVFHSFIFKSTFALAPQICRVEKWETEQEGIEYPGEG